MATPFPSPSAAPSPPLPPRRRGGQPSNRNAFRHGFYSRQPPTPLANLAQSIDRSRQDTADRDPVAIARSISDLHKQIDLLVHLCNELVNAGNISLFLALQKSFQKTINLSARLKLRLHDCLQPRDDLHFVAGHALALISYDFRDHCITRDADSFRRDTQKSDLNSLPSLEPFLPSLSEPDFPFLSPRQIQLLQPLLPVPNGFTGPVSPTPATKAPASSVEGPVPKVVMGPVLPAPVMKAPSSAAEGLPSPNP